MNTLIKLPNFPVSICTQDGELTDKEIMIDANIVEDNDGFIKFLPYVDPKLIYMSQHNSSIGKTWTQHNSEFVKFIYETEQNKIVDIGGGSGNIFNSFSKLNENVDWTIIDLNPPVESKNLTIIQGLYDSQIINKGDVVVTSHFVEHLFDLKSFLDNLHDRNPSYHIFSLPNFSYYAKNKYCSTLMFEHPNYLAEECLKYMLEITGWEVVDKKYFKEHSIFFKTSPIETKSKSPFKEEFKLDEAPKRDFSKEKEQGLHGWFERRGGTGKAKGWVDCNTCRDGKCKPCGREEGEDRKKPRCRPTPSQCKGYKRPDQR